MEKEIEEREPKRQQRETGLPNVISFEDREVGQRAQEHKQPPEAGKGWETDSPLDPPKGMQHC